MEGIEEMEVARPDGDVLVHLPHESAPTVPHTGVLGEVEKMTGVNEMEKIVFQNKKRPS